MALQRKRLYTNCKPFNATNPDRIHNLLNFKTIDRNDHWIIEKFQ